jgi:amidase
MVIQTPKQEQILEIALDFGLELSDEEARSFAGLIGGSVPSYNRLDELVEPCLPVKYPRTSGR